MGKSGGTALAVIALIVSIGVGGYFVYDRFIITPSTTSPSGPTQEDLDALEERIIDLENNTSNQYYKTGSYFIIPSGEAWSTGNSLSIEFTISEGESVYFSYEGTVILDDSSVPNTYVEFRFKVDGVIWTYPQRRARRYNAVSPGGTQLSVSMQHYNSTMSAGNHTVTVVCRGDHTTDSLRERSLFVQTFK